MNELKYGVNKLRQYDLKPITNLCGLWDINELEWMMKFCCILPLKRIDPFAWLHDNIE